MVRQPNNTKEDTVKSKLPIEVSLQFPARSPELIAVIYTLCILSEQFYAFTSL